MFNKTITRLAHSPSLEEELVAYSKSVRREEVMRQVGLVFVALVLVVQAFAVFFPPESANAGNTTDFMEGGFGTIDEYLVRYDNDTHGIQSLFSSLGITRKELADSRAGTLEYSEELIYWKMASFGESNDIAHDVLMPDGTPKTFYYAPIDSFAPVTAGGNKKQALAVYVGDSSSIGQFMLLNKSGNLISNHAFFDTCIRTSALPTGAPRPVSMSETQRCDTKITTSLSAKNIRSGTQAVSQVAKASDRIVYTLTLENNDKQAISIPPSVAIADILEYSELIDKGGASFNPDTNTLTWANSVISPGSVLQRQFIIRLLPVIPSTAIGRTNPFSYDCTISSAFGSVVKIPVNCPPQKTFEQIISQLPKTPVRVNIAFALTLTFISAFFYARSKQLRSEVNLIRHNYHQGSI